MLEDAPPVDSQTESVIGLALKIQDFLPEDSTELNALICSLIKDSETENLAYEYYQKAKGKRSFKPEKNTLKLLIRYLIRSRNWNSLSSFCDDLREFQALPDRQICCRLISACVRSRKLRLVNAFLDIFLGVDLPTATLAFNCSMKCCNELHMYSTTVGFYQRMKSAGLDFDPCSYCHVMKAYMKLGQYEKVVVAFAEFDNRKMIQIEKLAFVPLYSKIYFILCESLGKMGRPWEALEYFREMSSKGIPEDHLFYSSLISSFANQGEVSVAEELLQEAEGKGMVTDPALFMKLVVRYIKEGMMVKTLDVVAAMERASIRVSDCIFCAIVNGFAKKRGYKSAAKVYEDLVLRGCEPGQVTYASILNIYNRLGLYSKAETVYMDMERRGFDKCVVAYSSMVAAYAKMGRPENAVKLVAKMKERGCNPNVWTYNSLLDMHGRALNLRQVEKTWKEMERRKIEPDRVSYTTVISAYNRAREFKTCMKYYEEFKQGGGKIDGAMAGMMVAVLSKTNRVDQIIELLQEMKLQGVTELDARFYRSAMNALKDAGLKVEARWLQLQFKKP